MGRSTSDRSALKERVRYARVLMVAAAALAVGSFELLQAQERPDFSGTWVVEHVESQGPRGDGGFRGRRGDAGGGGFRGGDRGGGGGQDRGAGRGGMGRGGMFGAPYREGDRVTITQTGEALIVTDEARSLMSRYTFDGRETSNPGPGDGTVKSKASWEGVALVIESELAMSGPRGNMSLNTREIRSLSQDGQTMTLRTTTKMPFGTMSSTVTFARTDQAG